MLPTRPGSPPGRPPAAATYARRTGWRARCRNRSCGRTSSLALQAPLDVVHGGAVRLARFEDAAQRAVRLVGRVCHQRLEQHEHLLLVRLLDGFAIQLSELLEVMSRQAVLTLQQILDLLVVVG